MNKIIEYLNLRRYPSKVLKVYLIEQNSLLSDLVNFYFYTNEKIKLHLNLF
jgi:hypothetical protein